MQLVISALAKYDRWAEDEDLNTSAAGCSFVGQGPVWQVSTVDEISTRQKGFILNTNAAD